MLIVKDAQQTFAESVTNPTEVQDMEDLAEKTIRLALLMIVVIMMMMITYLFVIQIYH